MKKQILLLAATISLVGVPLLLVLASGSPITPADGAAKPQPSAAATTDVAEPPRAVVDEPDYNFGVMDPLQGSSHAFVVRNEGGQTLELRLGSTTCKCTLGKLSQRIIQPGESGEIVLMWNSGRKHPYYDHGATILTNDPKRPELQLRVRGAVRTHLRAVPEELLLPRVEPDRSSTGSCVVYTQVTTPITIVQASCTLDGSRVTFHPAGPATLSELEATSGWRVNVELPAGLPQGQVEGMVQVTVQREGEDSVETLELPLIAKVLRRLAVYGPGIDMSGTVDLGIVRSGQGAKHRLIMKVRDEEPDLVIRDIQVQPDFVKVQVTPYQTSTSATGLYHLDIEVPPDAPECVYLASPTGEIRIGIDHPRITDLLLKLRLAVKRTDR